MATKTPSHIPVLPLHRLSSQLSQPKGFQGRGGVHGMGDEAARALSWGLGTAGKDFLRLPLKYPFLGISISLCTASDSGKQSRGRRGLQHPRTAARAHPELCRGESPCRAPQLHLSGFGFPLFPTIPPLPGFGGAPDVCDPRGTAQQLRQRPLAQFKGVQLALGGWKTSRGAASPGKPGTSHPRVRPPAP